MGFPKVCSRWLGLVVVLVVVERVVGVEVVGVEVGRVEVVVERVVDLVGVAGLELPDEVEEPLAEGPLAVDVAPLAVVVDVVDGVVVFLIWVWSVSDRDVVGFWVVLVSWFLVVDVPPCACAEPPAESPLVVDVDPLAGLALGECRKVPVSSRVVPLSFRVVCDVAGLGEDELEDPVVDIVKRHEFHGLNCMETMSQKRISRKTINFNKNQQFLKK